MPITYAPPPPDGAPSDWTSVVQGNWFFNIQRLNQWKGGTTVVPSGTDPSPYFSIVSPGSLGADQIPSAIYVVSHGWAPGYRSAVTAQNGNLLWWGKDAYIETDGVKAWASDWAWSPMIASVPVNQNGLLQSIVAQDPNAIVLAWSWIDDSATDSGTLDLYEVYASEAYTHVNGMRLASALLMAIAPQVWSDGGVPIHLIGHSHGSKVATVAALTLQQRGYPVDHLTILDSPEGESTLATNASNLLGVYLPKLHIGNPSTKPIAGTFVDNYVSYFGVGYAGPAVLANIVEVALDATPVYWDPSYAHSYAAGWYGGAAAGAAAEGDPPVGLAWPPSPANYLPALNQNWPNADQWLLQRGSSIQDIYSYSTQSASTGKTWWTEGNVFGNPTTGLTFLPGPGLWPGVSAFHGTYDNSSSIGYGLAFDLTWTSPQIGDYFVIALESPWTGESETLFVMDGQSFPEGSTSVAINCDVSGTIPLDIYFLGVNGKSASRVTISNFRLVNVGSATGYLEVRRAEKVASRIARRRERAPRVDRPGVAGGTYPPPGAPRRAGTKDG